jgi:putative SOS response-associated peptidase YedK
MCGRYNMTKDPRVLIDAFAIARVLIDPESLEPRYNIAPSQDVPIVRDTPEGRVLSLARWGLVPHWSKEAKPKYSTINARAETVADKPTYREAFKRKRCLIPATGFYEWQAAAGHKTPHHIRLPEDELFAFAGLWDHWDKDGDGFDSCSIIVTGANATMRPIHERMPVILNPAHYGTWLNVQHFNRAQLEALLAPYDGALEAYPVSRHVNSPQHDDPRCTERLQDTGVA